MNNSDSDNFYTHYLKVREDHTMSHEDAISLIVERDNENHGFALPADMYEDAIIQHLHSDGLFYNYIEVDNPELHMHIRSVWQDYQPYLETVLHGNPTDEDVIQYKRLRKALQYLGELDEDGNII